MERVGHDYVEEIKKWKIHLFICNKSLLVVIVVDDQGSIGIVQIYSLLQQVERFYKFISSGVCGCVGNC